MKVVLVSAPISMKDRYGDFAGVGNSQPTNALAYLGAIALRENVSVRLIDASAKNLDTNSVYKLIADEKPGIVGFSSTTMGIEACGHLASLIKEAAPHIITIIGGCHVTALPEDTLSEFNGFDIGVIGEGEKTLEELLNSLKSGVISKSVEGTIVRDGDTIRRNYPRVLINNLDDLPFPAWNLLSGFPEEFIPSPARIKQTPCASIVFTRGCPNQCAFCDRSIFGNKVRSYSPGYAIEMIKDLYNNYGVKELLIEDDTFVISRKWITEFCERLIGENLGITWSCLGRADRIKPDILKLMKKAGCWHISYGIESGDQGMLDKMKKNETLKQIRDAVQVTKTEGVQSKGFFMIGFPGETKESLDETKQFALELPLDDISIMQFTPFPGSFVYENIDQYGEFSKNWKMMNILNTVFVPTGLSITSLEKYRSDILISFYLRPRIIFHKLILLTKNPRLIIYYLRAIFVLLKVIR